jgi:hypothetical protein
VPVVGPTRYNIVLINEIRQFAAYANYPTDMRKANGRIDLWPIQFSDCRADMRKSNMHNGLCQSSILARGGGAVRACLFPVRVDEKGSRSME